MKISCRQAKEILDFLARRVGYKTADFTSVCHDKKTIVFRNKSIMAMPHLDNLVGRPSAFYGSASYRSALEKMLEQKSHIYVVNGFDVSRSIPLFSENDTLESLMIQSELEITI